MREVQMPADENMIDQTKCEKTCSICFVCCIA